jgi:hypothetical protein
MHPITSIVMVFALATVPAAAAKPIIDYDHEYDFSKCQSFGWGDWGTLAGSELNQKRIDKAVVQGLNGVGLYESESPDLHVVTHALPQPFAPPGGTRIGFGVGGWGSSGGVGVGASTDVGSSKNDFGTLVIEIYDAKSGDLVWEAKTGGSGSADPEKMERNIHRAVEKAFKKYPVKKK